MTLIFIPAVAGGTFILITVHQQQLSAPFAFGNEEGITTKEPSSEQGVVPGSSVGTHRSGQWLYEECFS